jgi:hypothetical protein
MAIRLRPLALLGTALKRCLLPVLACSSLGFAQAAYIDFEDLPPIPGNEDLTGYPITDQYADLGVTFTSGAYLVHWIPDAYVLSDLDQQDLIFRFTGDVLPTHVSFELGTVRPTDVRWRGATGRGENIRIDGEGPGQVSFASQAGIALVKVTFPFYVKGPGHIGLDNLYFGAVPAVPEPAPLGLAGVGLLTLLAVALRKQRPSWAKAAPPLDNFED